MSFCAFFPFLCHGCLFIFLSSIWIFYLKIFSLYHFWKSNIIFLVIWWVTLKFLICTLIFKSIVNKYLFLLLNKNILLEYLNFDHTLLSFDQYSRHYFVLIPKITLLLVFTVADLFRFHHVYSVSLLIFPYSILDLLFKRVIVLSNEIHPLAVPFVDVLFISNFLLFCFQKILFFFIS